MKLFPVEKIREWDAYTILNEPISSGELMERAGKACTNWILENLPGNNTFAIFCGTGNNGGDGLVIARLLIADGKNAGIYILEGSKRSNDFIANLEKLQSLSIEVQFIESDDPLQFTNDTIIIDALFGTGLSKPLTGREASLVTAINRSRCTIISIDIPSGLYADKNSTGNPVIKGDFTLSFQQYKLAFMMAENATYTGKVHVLDIALNQTFYQNELTSLFTIGQEEVINIYKPRDQFSHKYNFGHALLYAGSKQMMGAAILCAKACLRSGAGLVTVCAESDTQGTIQTAIPEAITSTEKDWKILSVKKKGIAIGPGLEPGTGNELLITELLQHYEGGLVIDATGLHLLANKELSARPGNRTFIITPHTGEFEKLFGKTTNDFERLNLCCQKALELNCVIILKGHHTIVACPDGDIYFNTTGNAGMATAGSGDVLTGIVAALLAQGYSEKEAAILGVFLQGSAGDHAAAARSQESMIASDIVDSLGRVFLEIKNAQIARGPSGNHSIQEP